MLQRRSHPRLIGPMSYWTVIELSGGNVNVWLRLQSVRHGTHVPYRKDQQLPTREVTEQNKANHAPLVLFLSSFDWNEWFR